MESNQTEIGMMFMARKKSNRLHGHYCKICGEYKANEKFSGKGHAAHICKACAKLPAAEKAERETITRLMNLPMGRLSESQKKWLKNRTQDSRPEVSALAREIYNAHFPHAERNAMKKQLLINNLEFEVHTDIYDEYGDEWEVNQRFTADRKNRELTMTDFDTGKAMEIAIDGGKMSKLLRWIVHTLEIFMWEQDYGLGPETLDPDVDLSPDFYDEDETFSADEYSAPEGPPCWRVKVEYSNHKEQQILSVQDFLDDRPEEGYCELLSFFGVDENEMFFGD